MRIGIVGHDPYTIPIAEALNRQPDFTVVGAYSHEITPFSKLISHRIAVYCGKSGLPSFKRRGIRVSGFIEDFIEGTDVFLEYDPASLGMRISYGSSGILIRPNEVILERLSLELPIEEVSLREIPEDIACCPFFRVFRAYARLGEDTPPAWFRDALLSIPRAAALSGDRIDIRSLCALLPVALPHLSFMISVPLGSIKQDDASSRRFEFISILGYLVALPEAIDTLRESEGMRRDLSRAITNEYLSIKGGLIL